MPDQTKQQTLPSSEPKALCPVGPAADCFRLAIVGQVEEKKVCAGLCGSSESASGWLPFLHPPDDLHPRQTGVKDSHAGDHSGSVLILVLLLISILVVTVMESMRQMQVESASSAMFAGSFQGRTLARSGVAFARALLVQDALDEDSKADHQGETWAGFLEQNDIPLPELTTGELNGTMVDEQGKFPINDLVSEKGQYSAQFKQVLERLLAARLNEEEIEPLMQALKDWLDPDDNPTGEFGAESFFYQSEGQSYGCANGPFLSLQELLLVRGMTPKLFYGTEDAAGLRDLLTVHTTETVNINTASPDILAAMVNPSVRMETAREFALAAAEYRQDPRHFEYLGESDWYRNRVAGYNDIQLPGEMVATSSNTFSVQVQADVNGIVTSMFAVLKREKQGDKATVATVVKEVQ